MWADIIPLRDRDGWHVRLWSSQYAVLPREIDVMADDVVGRVTDMGSRAQVYIAVQNVAAEKLGIRGSGGGTGQQ